MQWSPPQSPWTKDGRAADNRNHKCLHWWWIHRQQVIQHTISTPHDEPQQGQNSCLQLYHLLFGMAGEAITGSRLNRTESPFPSLLNPVYSEAGWFGVIIPVISQAVPSLPCTQAFHLTWSLHTEQGTNEVSGLSECIASDTLLEFW